MKNSNVKTIALAGVMGAAVFVTLLIETYVFTPLLALPAAIISIPVAIALSLYSNWKAMFLGGTILGLCSFILSFIVGLTPFMNPLISVMPRVLMGCVSYGVFYLFSKLFGKAKNKFVNTTLPLALAGCIGVLTNTVAVLGMMAAFGGGGWIESVLATLVGINFLFEFIASILLVPALATAFRKINKTNV